MAHIVFKSMMGTQNASSLHFRDIGQRLLSPGLCVTSGCLFAYV